MCSIAAGAGWRVRWIAWQRIEFCHWPERRVLIGSPAIEWRKVNIHAPFAVMLQPGGPKGNQGADFRAFGGGAAGDASDDHPRADGVVGRFVDND